MRTIYNVMVKGVSIGMTFSLQEAFSWKKEAANPDETKVIGVNYHGN